MTENDITGYEKQMLSLQGDKIKLDAINGGIFSGAGAEQESSREFYLNSTDLLDGLYCYLTGRDFIGNERDKSIALMEDSAARFLVNNLRIAVDKVGRLSNFERKDVNRLTYDLREVVAGWLVTEGWLRHNININYFRPIVKQSEMLIFASLKWGYNAGGQTFMTRSIHSFENFNQIQAQQPQQNPVIPGTQNKKGGIRRFMPF